MNQNPYLVGGRYEEGRNFFKDRVYFLPFAMPLAGTGAYQKQTCPAMAMDFSTAEGQLQAVHVIDRDYAYRLFTAGFEEMKPLAEKKGASLAALDGEWLAMSDHSRASDQLFFFDIRDGGLRPAYTGQGRRRSAIHRRRELAGRPGLLDRRAPGGAGTAWSGCWCSSGASAMNKAKLLLLPLALLLMPPPGRRHQALLRGRDRHAPE